MTDIICPVCGKTNPAEAETCQFCQAPLKTSAFTPDFDEASDLPDWLRSLNADQGAFPVTGTGEEPAKVPDWLSNIGGVTKEEQPSEAPAEPAAGKPDWLADLIQGEPAEPLPADLPDWLAGQAPASATPFSGDEQDWTADWMAGEGTAEQTETSAEPVEEETPSSIPAFTFDSLESFEEQETPTTTQDEAEGTGDLLSTLPDWVANVTAEDAEAEGGEGEGELAPAQLPSWLEAMRPAEADQPSVPPEDLSGFTAESSGPLIGLRGVLSAEPVGIRTRRAAAYSIKLRVTDEQKQRVTLLEQLLADEPKPKALPSAPMITAQYVFRLLIAVALLLPVLWAVVSNGRLTPLPDPTAAPGVMAMYNLIQRLPADAPVLVAFDYEAGYSGEMDAAGSAVLEHLLNRGASLALVSTSATGPALAERFIANLNQQPERLNNPYTNYANLGYIPGGTIGLYSLARSVHSTLPYDLHGIDVWASGPLSSVQDLADFGLVLVLVSDPETARAWVEQAGPILKQNGTALAMITSAQTTPLVQPYFAGNPRQVEGLIAGMAGGAAYESASAVNGPAHLAWDAYSLGLAVSVLVILIGTLVDVSYKALRVEMKGK
ncbi:MAG: hypothetical protein JW726_04250 [Anaerolineales bacterium]|nr:hypothetical protein [Anaerolineales bacterium]